MAISAFFAPVMAFLLWSTLAAFPPAHPLDFMAFGLYPLMVATVTGALPAFVFGGLLAWAFELQPRRREGRAAIAGASAAALYVGVTYGLESVGVGWVGYFGIWAPMLASRPGLAGALTVVTIAIVASGALAAVVYVKVAER